MLRANEDGPWLQSQAKTMYETFAIFAIFIFVYSTFSGGLSRTTISGPIIFTVFGLLAGPQVLGWLDVDVEAEAVRGLAELTLAIVLFTDAANTDLPVLQRSTLIPRRLLLMGLPLTIGLGFVVGIVMFPDMGMFELAILATALAPTDAALGESVVSNPAVPTRIREGLNVESGLNDGICVPVLLLFLALVAEAHVAGGTTRLALTLFIQEIGIGTAIGLLFTVLAGAVTRYAHTRNWIDPIWQQVIVLAIALACFSLPEPFGGSGFIAAFVGGLTFGAMARTHKKQLLLDAEATGKCLGLVTWVLFGIAVLGPHLETFSWQVVAYSILSLTLIRMLPVYLVLGGTGLNSPEKLFVSWFGPRGLASIVFAVMIINAGLPHGSEIASTIVCTIMLSVVAHGSSANPWIAALSRRLGTGQG